MKTLLTLLPSLVIASFAFGQATQDSAVRQKYENTQDTPDHIAFFVYLSHVSAFSQLMGQQEATHSVADMLSGGRLKHTSEESERAARIYNLLVEAHQTIAIDVQQSVNEIICKSGYSSRSQEEQVKAMDDRDDAEEDIYRDHYAKTISQLDADAVEALLAKLDDVKGSLVVVKLDHAKHYAESGLDAGSAVTNICSGR